MEIRSMSLRRLFLALMAMFPGILLSNQQAAGQTIHYVDNLGDCAQRAPCHPTIMDAVNAAVPSDAIEVFPSVYREAVVFDDTKDHITLRAYASALRPVVASITLRVSGVQVRDFVVEGGVVTERMIGGMNAVLQGNTIGSVRFWSCGNSTVTKNRVAGGLIVDHDATGCVFEGNIVDGGVRVGLGDVSNRDNVVRRNVVRGGIDVEADNLYGAIVESNLVESGGIGLVGVGSLSGNVARYNIVRGGGIDLAILGQTPAGGNTIEANFVSGSPGDGIAIRIPFGGGNLIKRNTSVENAGCDLHDYILPGWPPNTWTENRFRTKCGIPDE